MRNRRPKNAMRSARRPAKASKQLERSSAKISELRKPQALERRAAKTARLRKPQALPAPKSGKKRDPMTEALRYLTISDRSAAQMERYLSDRGYARSIVQKIMGTLHRLRYVDDRTVALRMAQSWIARRPMAREALTAKLTDHAFAEGSIAAAVSHVYEATTEQAVAEEFLKSLPTRYPEGRREDRRRAMLLAARGFSTDLIDTLLPGQGAPDA